MDYRCDCGGRLTFEYPLAELVQWTPSGAGLHRYLPLLPAHDSSAGMGEGGTPLVESRSIGSALGIRLYFKLESLNPTGSYKDRVAAVGAALARAHHRPALIATSSGNGGAAIAAYGARAGLSAVLVVPEEVPAAKLMQIRAYGAVVVTVRGVLSGPQAARRMFEAVMQVAARYGWLPMITAYRYAPGPMEGVKTLAYEIVESLRDAPDRVYVPVGGGGLLAATWRGFVEATVLGWTRRTPRMVAVQPEGCAPVARAALGLSLPDSPVTTAVSGLQVSDPPDVDLVLEAITASSGSAVMVSDVAVHAAQQALARDEGIFAEPAGAASLAALLADVRAGRVPRGAIAVCLITGNGFKDPTAFSTSGDLPVLAVNELDGLGHLAAALVEERSSRSRA